MTNNCSSLDILNFLVGFCRNDRFIFRQLSRRNVLVYDIHALEAKVVSNSQTSVPDAILTSPLTSHVLVIEAKGGRIGKEAMIKQLKKHSNIDLECLVNQVAVPPSYCKSKDLWLICSDSVFKDFSSFDVSKELGIVVSVLRHSSQPKGYVFELMQGTFGHARVQEMFSKPIAFTVLPKLFLFDFVHPTEKELKPIVIQELVSLASRGVNSFTLESLATNTVPYWQQIGARAQKDVFTFFRRILRRICSYKGASGPPIVRTGSNPDLWTFSDSSPVQSASLGKKLQRSLFSGMKADIEAAIDGQYDLGFDDDSDDLGE